MESVRRSGNGDGRVPTAPGRMSGGFGLGCAVGDRCLDVIDDCVQISGGIGVTWEHDIHLYSRRAAVNRAVYGSPEQHKERVAVLLGT